MKNNNLIELQAALTAYQIKNNEFLTFLIVDKNLGAKLKSISTYDFNKFLEENYPSSFNYLQQLQLPFTGIERFKELSLNTIEAEDNYVAFVG